MARSTWRVTCEGDCGDTHDDGFPRLKCHHELRRDEIRDLDVQPPEDGTVVRCNNCRAVRVVA